MSGGNLSWLICTSLSSHHPSYQGRGGDTIPYHSISCPTIPYLSIVHIPYHTLAYPLVPYHTTNYPPVRPGPGTLDLPSNGHLLLLEIHFKESLIGRQLPQMESAERQKCCVCLIVHIRKCTYFFFFYCFFQLFTEKQNDVKLKNISGQSAGVIIEANPPPILPSK